MKKIRVNISVHRTGVVTEIRFYFRNNLWVEYSVDYVNVPKSIIERIENGDSIKDVFKYVMSVVKEAIEDGKQGVKINDKSLDDFSGAFVITLNSEIDENSNLKMWDVHEARHIELKGNGGGKDITYAFEGKMKSQILRNILTQVVFGDTEKLNTIFKALRL